MQQVGECVMTHCEWRECGLMGCPLTHPLRVMTEEEEEGDVAAPLLTVRWRRSIGRSTDVLYRESNCGLSVMHPGGETARVECKLI